MDQTEFRRIVRYGLGRAVLHLQQNDPAPYIAIIYEACRTNECYDRQVNGDRTQFYWDLIGSASADETILLGLIDEFSASDEVPYWIVDLIERFALHGDRRAIEYLISAFEDNPTSWDTIDAILQIDGLQGIVKISKELMNLHQSREDVHDAARHALNIIERKLSSALSASSDDKIRMSAAHRAIGNLREMAKREVQRSRPQRDQQESTSKSRIRLNDPSKIPFKVIWSCVEQQIKTGRIRSTSIVTPYGVTTYRDWGMNAPDLEIEHAAHELAAVAPTDVARIARYARIFAERPYPLDPQPLIDTIETNIDSGGRDYWTDAAGWAVHCCLWALSWISDPALLEIALALRNRTDHWRSYWTLLFPPDADSEYVDLLSRSIRSETDEEVIHSWGSDLVRRAERTPAQVFSQSHSNFSTTAIPVVSVDAILSSSSRNSMHCQSGLLRSVGTIPTRLRGSSSRR